MNELIMARADVNITNKEHSAALFIAVQKGNLGVVKMLISTGADVNTKNKYHNTPLNSSIIQGKY